MRAVDEVENVFLPYLYESEPASHLTSVQIKGPNLGAVTAVYVLKEVRSLDVVMVGWLGLCGWSWMLIWLARFDVGLF